MRIFLAGATGVLGVRLVPLLVEAGHDVVGMTRSPARANMLTELGATPVVCDVYDTTALTTAVVGAAPDLVMHQLTDLPDNPDHLGPAAFAANARIRIEGTDNLLAAARTAGASHVVAQSIAWRASNSASVEHLEHRGARLRWRRAPLRPTPRPRHVGANRGRHPRGRPEGQRRPRRLRHSRPPHLPYRHLHHYRLTFSERSRRELGIE